MFRVGRIALAGVCVVLSAAAVQAANHVVTNDGSRLSVPGI